MSHYVLIHNGKVLFFVINSIFIHRKDASVHINDDHSLQVNIDQQRSFVASVQIYVDQ